jgi:IS5 family transposase
VNAYLASKGIRITTGTIVDATIIHAPSSTKNAKGERDPEMHQTRKGNQWHFGMKADIGVDSKEVIVHSVCTSAASVSDVHMLPELLHGEEKKVWGDGGYQGQTQAIHAVAPGAQDMTSRRVKTKAGVDQAERCKNRTKARVRARRTRQVGVAISHLEARVRLYQGALPRLEEESRVAVCELRPGGHLPAPQTARQDEPSNGHRGGVVCPPEAKRVSGGQKNSNTTEKMRRF